MIGPLKWYEVAGIIGFLVLVGLVAYAKHNGCTGVADGIYVSCKASQ